jgi:hypothetical protein
MASTSKTKPKKGRPEKRARSEDIDDLDPGTLTAEQEDDAEETKLEFRSKE